ncbi:long-chain fatty acid--CoA ligase [Aquisalimonas sp.]|uniref:long-chain fatty acid--CoA ligase n=1 Tax=unclassified Aquisalimonas TaxID=2644645 RepID=UPI0025C33D32|nr:long-chain fatty acid--CoA ligase [Aquisalimonas sp.]
MIQATMQDAPLSLNHFLERAGRLYGESELVTRRPDKSLVTHTYAAFHQRSLALASALQAAGLKPGDRVATLCWNHHAHLECYFGIPAAGGVMHTLNLRLGADELAWIMNHAEDRFLIVDDVLLPLLEQVRDQVSLERVIVFPFSGMAVDDAFTDYEQFLAGAPTGFQYPEHDENDPVAMCYTSGTTGRPKGVVYSHRSAVLHTLSACLPDSWGLTAGDAVLPVTPMFHANSWGVPYACVMLGLKMIFPGPHLHPEDLLDLFEQTRPTYSLGVPSIWLPMADLMDKQPERWALPAHMRMLVGGSAMPESAIRAFARHGMEVTHGWGMTETSPLASVASIKPELQHLDDDARFPYYATAGLPQPLVDLRIVGDDGVEPPWDGEVTGEIQVHGPFITGSYYQAPDAADKFTPDGWLRTGDVASIDRHGYIRIVDRTKDLIKSGGEWISSVDLENAIMAHPRVAEAAVIAVPHPKWAERPLACVVRKPGQDVSPESIRNLLAERFARWQLPDDYIFMDELPHTSTGKLSKATLRQMHEAGQLPKTE